MSILSKNATATTRTAAAAAATTTTTLQQKGYSDSSNDMTIATTPHLQRKEPPSITLLSPSSQYCKEGVLVSGTMYPNHQA